MQAFLSIVFEERNQVLGTCFGLSLTFLIFTTKQMVIYFKDLYDMFGDEIKTPPYQDEEGLKAQHNVVYQWAKKSQYKEKIKSILLLKKDDFDLAKKEVCDDLVKQWNLNKPSWLEYFDGELKMHRKEHWKDPLEEAVIYMHCHAGPADAGEIPVKLIEIRDLMTTDTHDSMQKSLIHIKNQNNEHGINADGFGEKLLHYCVFLKDKGKGDTHVASLLARLPRSDHPEEIKRINIMASTCYEVDIPLSELLSCLGKTRIAERAEKNLKIYNATRSIESEETKHDWDFPEECNRIDTVERKEITLNETVHEKGFENYRFLFTPHGDWKYDIQGQHLKGAKGSPEFGYDVKIDPCYGKKIADGIYTATSPRMEYDQPCIMLKNETNNQRYIVLNPLIDRLDVTVKVLIGSSGGDVYFFGAIERDSLALFCGTTVRFDTTDPTNNSHPFKLSSTNADISTGSEYTEGVEYYINGVVVNGSDYVSQYATGAGSGFRGITWTVPHDVSTTYYYCTNDDGMGKDGRLTSITDVKTDKAYDYNWQCCRSSHKFLYPRKLQVESHLLFTPYAEWGYKVVSDTVENLQYNIKKLNLKQDFDIRADKINVTSVDGSTITDDTYTAKEPLGHTNGRPFITIEGASNNKYKVWNPLLERTEFKPFDLTEVPDYDNLYMKSFNGILYKKKCKIEVPIDLYKATKAYVYTLMVDNKKEKCITAEKMPFLGDGLEETMKQSQWKVEPYKKSDKTPDKKSHKKLKYVYEIEGKPVALLGRFVKFELKNHADKQYCFDWQKLREEVTKKPFDDWSKLEMQTRMAEGSEMLENALQDIVSFRITASMPEPYKLSASKNFAEIRKYKEENTAFQQRVSQDGNDKRQGDSKWMEMYEKCLKLPHLSDSWMRLGGFNRLFPTEEPLDNYTDSTNEQNYRYSYLFEHSHEKWREFVHSQVERYRDRFERLLESDVSFKKSIMGAAPLKNNTKEDLRQKKEQAIKDCKPNPVRAVYMMDLIDFNKDRVEAGNVYEATNKALYSLIMNKIKEYINSISTNFTTYLYPINKQDIYDDMKDWVRENYGSWLTGMGYASKYVRDQLGELKSSVPSKPSKFQFSNDLVHPVFEDKELNTLTEIINDFFNVLLQETSVLKYTGSDPLHDVICTEFVVDRTQLSMQALQNKNLQWIGAFRCAQEDACSRLQIDWILRACKKKVKVPAQLKSKEKMCILYKNTFLLRLVCGGEYYTDQAPKRNWTTSDLDDNTKYYVNCDDDGNLKIKDKNNKESMCFRRHFIANVDVKIWVEEDKYPICKIKFGDRDEQQFISPYVRPGTFVQTGEGETIDTSTEQGKRPLSDLYSSRKTSAANYITEVCETALYFLNHGIWEQTSKTKLYGMKNIIGEFIRKQLSKNDTTGNTVTVHVTGNIPERTHLLDNNEIWKGTEQDCEIKDPKKIVDEVEKRIRKAKCWEMVNTARQEYQGRELEINATMEVKDDERTLRKKMLTIIKEIRDFQHPVSSYNTALHAIGIMRQVRLMKESLNLKTVKKYPIEHTLSSRIMKYKPSNAKKVLTNDRIFKFCNGEILSQGKSYSHVISYVDWLNGGRYYIKGTPCNLRAEKKHGGNSPVSALDEAFKRGEASTPMILITDKQRPNSIFSDENVGLYKEKDVRDKLRLGMRVDLDLMKPAECQCASNLSNGGYSKFGYLVSVNGLL